MTDDSKLPSVLRCLQTVVKRERECYAVVNMAMYTLLGNTENICFLCSIVNKMLVYEVCKLVFTFYTVSQLLVICIVLRTYTFEAQNGHLDICIRNTHLL